MKDLQFSIQHCIYEHLYTHSSLTLANCRSTSFDGDHYYFQYSGLSEKNVRRSQKQKGAFLSRCICARYINVSISASISPLLLVHIQSTKPSTAEEVLLCLFCDEQNARPSLSRVPKFEDSPLLASHLALCLPTRILLFPLLLFLPGPS